MPGFWDDLARAQKTMREKGALEKNIGEYEACEKLLDDAAEFAAFAEEENDEATALEAQAFFDEATQRIEQANLRTLL